MPALRQHQQPMALDGKHIVLGISGGIAAYKCAQLVREFVKRGAEVQVVMTRSAAQFVAPITLATLSRRPVVSELFPPAGDAADSWTRHVDLGLWADLMLIAPATANTIAKIAHGFADNALTALVLALRSPLAVAPSMDVDMYRHAATQRNIALLRERGCIIIAPNEGELASGLSGPGRLPEPAELVRRCEEILAGNQRDLAGKRILVTAGPTYEPIDPVRYLGNRSSGKMGFALAAAAAERGADVTLISGPVQLPTPPCVRRIDVTTAAEMHDAVLREFSSTDMLIMAAAVADFTPAEPAERKIKREQSAPDGGLTLALRQNPDILKEAGARKSHQRVVGFALETDDGIANARAKLAAKQLDAIVLNNPLDPGAGFNTDTNCVTVISADGGAEQLPLMSKRDVAHQILNRVAPLLR